MLQLLGNPMVSHLKKRQGFEQRSVRGLSSVKLLSCNLTQVWLCPKTRIHLILNYAFYNPENYHSTKYERGDHI